MTQMRDTERLLRERIFDLREQLRTAETTLAHAEAFIEHQDMSYRWAEWCEGRDPIPAKIGHGRLTEPAEQAQGSGDARSHPAELFATVRNLRLDGWEREVALKRIEEQLEVARKERSDAVEVAARAMDRSQSLQEQLEFWQREAARHCDHARSAQEQLEVLCSAAESSSDMEAHS